MGLIRIDAIQGHAVPNGYSKTLGPFPPELYARNPRAEDSDWTDPVHETYDDVRMFRCKDCGGILEASERTSHSCEWDD